MEASPADQKPSRLRRVSARQIIRTCLGFSLGMVWYASPDFVLDRKRRRLVRLAVLFPLGILTGAVIRDTFSQVRQDITQESPDHSAWEMTSETVHLDKDNIDWAAISRYGIVASLAAAFGIWSEISLFRRSERRRLAGVKFAHTRQAVPIAALFAAGYLLDDLQSS